MCCPVLCRMPRGRGPPSGALTPSFEPLAMFIPGQMYWRCCGRTRETEGERFPRLPGAAASRAGSHRPVCPWTWKGQTRSRGVWRRVDSLLIRAQSRHGLHSPLWPGHPGGMPRARRLPGSLFLSLWAGEGTQGLAEPGKRCDHEPHPSPDGLSREEMK